MSGAAVQPRVTVICPTYNSQASLRCALRSVLNQDFTDFELRVVGDACTDGTEETIAALNDPRVLWTNFPKNTGSQTEPNNTALRAARGRFVAFIGHDDLWFPWHLSRLVEFAERNGADLVHDLAAMIGPEGIEGVHGPPDERSGYARVYFPTSTWLHRRELTEQIGFWRQPDELSWPIDYDFTRRAALAGKKIECRRSLGVLKFHSRRWKLYARTGEAAQERWLNSLLANPSRLNEDILAQLAGEYARHFQVGDKTPPAVAWSATRMAAGSFVKACVRELVYRFGEERWPLAPLLRRRMKRQRSEGRVERGLTPLDL